MPLRLKYPKTPQKTKQINKNRHGLQQKVGESPQAR